MAYCESNLNVNNPDDGSEHCSTHDGHVSSLASSTKSLVMENGHNEGENGDRGIDSIANPTKYSVPIKKQISRPLLIQSREL